MKGLARRRLGLPKTWSEPQMQRLNPKAGSASWIFWCIGLLYVFFNVLCVFCRITLYFTYYLLMLDTEIFFYKVCPAREKTILSFIQLLTEKNNFQLKRQTPVTDTFSCWTHYMYSLTLTFKKYDNFIFLFLSPLVFLLLVFFEKFYIWFSRYFFIL